ncbi:hypothetical protein FRC08_004214 [Ceratobasidium sp. 394]|nr:hypothetical protein FRC08_004214 [Ceratobasidium sp. 394]
MVTQTVTYSVTYTTCVCWVWPIAGVVLTPFVATRDRKWIKWMVAWLFVIDTVNTIFDIGLVWRYTITFFGNLEEITHSHWLLNVEPAMTTMISSTIQSFYAWRIARLTERAWMGWVLGFLALVQFGAGLAATIWASFLGDFSRFQEVKSLVITWLGLSALTDMLITCALTWYLFTHRTGFPRTDDIITRLIRMTVQTGLVTTIWATIDMILFLALPVNNLHLFFQLPLCKLYTNTLMSMLNARKGWDRNFVSVDTSEPTLRSGDDLKQKPIRSTWVRRSAQFDLSNQNTAQIATITHPEDNFELTDYTSKGPKPTDAGDIESRAGSGEVTGVHFPGATSRSAFSDMTSTRSRASSDKR